MDRSNGKHIDPLEERAQELMWEGEAGQEQLPAAEEILISPPEKKSAFLRKYHAAKRFFDRKLMRLLIGFLRVVIIAVCSVGLIAYGVDTLYHYVEEEYISPIDAQSDAFYEIVIPSGSSVSKIGRILEDNNIIRSKATFKLSADINEVAGKLRAGTYYLSPSMSIETILDILTIGTAPDKTAKVVIVEGRTAKDIAQILVDAGILSNTATFLKLCNDPEPFDKYGFINDMIQKGTQDRRYVLEGYLFPDTYEFYMNATEESIIQKLLARTDEIFNEEYRLRAQEMGYTMDEILTLASIIEKEAIEQDFVKVSAVFHNRLNSSYPRLECCSTVQYISDKNNLVLTQEQLNMDSPYNTYRVSGLPEGPICNPGKAAIEAALYPDETMIEEGYLFFCLTDPQKGELVFAKTLEEHNANKVEWQPLWEEHDQGMGE
ncbi:MAG: endolytic transglycosylase MltG [Christensenellales bacterium]